MPVKTNEQSAINGSVIYVVCEDKNNLKPPDRSHISGRLKTRDLPLGRTALFYV